MIHAYPVSAHSPPRQRTPPMTETDAQTRRDIARAMLRMFEEVEGAAVDRMLSALRFAESNLPAESHPSAIREAVEGEREACAKLVAAHGIAGMPFDVGSWTPGAVAAAIRARGEEKGK